MTVDFGFRHWLTEKFFLVFGIKLFLFLSFFIFLIVPILTICCFVLCCKVAAPLFILYCLGQPKWIVFFFEKKNSSMYTYARHTTKQFCYVGFLLWFYKRSHLELKPAVLAGNIKQSNRGRQQRKYIIIIIIVELFCACLLIKKWPKEKRLSGKALANWAPPMERSQMWNDEWIIDIPNILDYFPASRYFELATCTQYTSLQSGKRSE